MASESFEPMQVDAAEENDNDGDVDLPMVQIPGNVAEAANGGFALPLAGLASNVQRGELYGEPSRQSFNVENPTIDLETYAQGYTGLACLYRLRFIAHHCPSLRLEALKLAISMSMNTHNTVLFSELNKKMSAAQSESSAGAVSGSNLPDIAVTPGAGANLAAGGPNERSSLLSTNASVRDWIETCNKKAALKLEKLDTDLKNYKSNSIKVSLLFKPPKGIHPNMT